MYVPIVTLLHLIGGLQVMLPVMQHAMLQMNHVKFHNMTPDIVPREVVYAIQPPLTNGGWRTAKPDIEVNKWIKMFFDIDFQPIKNIKIKIFYFFSTQNLQDK